MNASAGSARSAEITPPPIPQSLPPLFVQPFPRWPSIRGKFATALHEAAVVILGIGAPVFLVGASGQGQGRGFRFQQALAGNCQRGFAWVLAKLEFHGAVFIHPQGRLAHRGKRCSVMLPPALLRPCAYARRYYISQPTHQQQQKHPGDSVHFYLSYIGQAASL